MCWLQQGQLRGLCCCCSLWPPHAAVTALPGPTRDSVGGGSMHAKSVCGSELCRHACREASACRARPVTGPNLASRTLRVPPPPCYLVITAATLQAHPAQVRGLCQGWLHQCRWRRWGRRWRLPPEQHRGEAPLIRGPGKPCSCPRSVTHGLHESHPLTSLLLLQCLLGQKPLGPGVLLPGSAHTSAAWPLQMMGTLWVSVLPCLGTSQTDTALDLLAGHLQQGQAALGCQCSGRMHVSDVPLFRLLTACRAVGSDRSARRGRALGSRVLLTCCGRDVPCPAGSALH